LRGFGWEEDGHIVGNVNTALFRRRGKTIWVIANVAVHPGYRRRGIARTLVFQAMQHARERGAASIWLQVRDDNPGAIQLYAQLGFVTRSHRTIWMVEPA
jgi:ribosomal protein S18 acetylase RimI-like enzyme